MHILFEEKKEEKTTEHVKEKSGRMENLDRKFLDKLLKKVRKKSPSIKKLSRQFD